MPPRTTAILPPLLFCLALFALFALIATHALTPGALPELDQSVASWFHRHARPGWTSVALAYTHLHGTIGILCMCALLACFMLQRRAWSWCMTLAVTVPGGMLFNYLLKNLFQRQRPQFEQPLVVAHGYSFPSGHTIGATLFYCALAAWLLTLPQAGTHHVRRLGIIAMAIILSVLTAFSRVYLGAHFLSDVLAAMLEGIGWFTLWTTIIFAFERHQLSRMSSKQF